VSTANSAEKYVNAVVNGRNDYPPKVRTILAQQGDQVIVGITIGRTPVPSVLTSILSVASGGTFGANLKNSPYDTLFHLFLRLELDNGTVVSLEKNEVINMDINPPLPANTQTQVVTQYSEGLTPNGILGNAQNYMGGKFFTYSARDNNCQDFILAIFNSNNIGTAEDKSFVKQDTKQLFGNMTGLRKLSNTVTGIGATVNTITTGSGLTDKVIKHLNKDNKEMIKLSKAFKKHLKTEKISGKGGFPSREAEYYSHQVINTESITVEQLRELITDKEKLLRSANRELRVLENNLQRLIARRADISSRKSMQDLIEEKDHYRNEIAASIDELKADLEHRSTPAPAPAPASAPPSDSTDTNGGGLKNKKIKGKGILFSSARVAPDFYHAADENTDDMTVEQIQALLATTLSELNPYRLQRKELIRQRRRYETNRERSTDFNERRTLNELIQTCQEQITNLDAELEFLHFRMTTLRDDLRERQAAAVNTNGGGLKVNSVNFNKIKWGTLTTQLKTFQKKHPSITTLEDFSNYILTHPKEFREKTLQRAHFYINVVRKGKGIENKISTNIKMPKYPKGSQQAKDFMASIRAKKGKGIPQTGTIAINIKNRKAITGTGASVDTDNSDSDSDDEIAQGQGLYASGGHGLYSSGNGLYSSGADTGGQGVHIHHHYHIGSKGGSLKSIGNDIKNAFSKKNITHNLDVAGHYIIPSITGALGGAAGSLVGGPAGGVAGSALGGFAGNQIDKALGIQNATNINTGAGIGKRKQKK